MNDLIKSKPLNNLLQTDVSRKEFLTTVGFGTASIVGFSSVIKMMSGKSSIWHLHTTAAHGYGAGAYEGSKNNHS